MIADVGAVARIGNSMGASYPGSGQSRLRLVPGVHGRRVGASQREQHHRPPTTHAPALAPIMVKSLVGALALAALPSALAFRNTSPFFLFSTAEYASVTARRAS